MVLRQSMKETLTEAIRVIYVSIVDYALPKQHGSMDSITPTVWDQDRAGDLRDMISNVIWHLSEER